MHSRTRRSPRLARRFAARLATLGVLGGSLACGVPENPEVLRSEHPEDPAPEEASSTPASQVVDVPSELGVVMFLGTSLTAGLGLPDSEEAFPAKVRERIVEAGLPFTVSNAGVSGDTSAGGLNRLDWLLRAPVHVLVLELGANDGLRGQDIEAMRANLLDIIDRVRTRYPDVQIILAGMRAPPNLGERYTARFQEIFPEVARETQATLIPFLLEGVAGVPELNQADGIHPTADGHEVIAATVWASLEPVLRRFVGR